MKTVKYILVGLVLLAAPACFRHPIPLGIVRHTPVYFRNDMLFGESVKLMDEKNEFIVATGLIDTTDEHPPVEVAFVSIDNRLLQLIFIDRSKKEDVITNSYYGNGFALMISYTIQEAADHQKTFENAHIRITKKDWHSEYKVFAKRGYL